VFDFNTQTAAGSWNSLYVFAILIAAVLMAALVWSFGSSEEAGGSTNSNSEENSPDLPAADHDSDEFPKEVITYDHREYFGCLCPFYCYRCFTCLLAFFLLAFFSG